MYDYVSQLVTWLQHIQPNNTIELHLTFDKSIAIELRHYHPVNVCIYNERSLQLLLFFRYVSHSLCMSLLYEIISYAHFAIVLQFLSTSFTLQLVLIFSRVSFELNQHSLITNFHNFVIYFLLPLPQSFSHASLLYIDYLFF